MSLKPYETIKMKDKTMPWENPDVSESAKLPCYVSLFKAEINYCRKRREKMVGNTVARIQLKSRIETIEWCLKHLMEL